MSEIVKLVEVTGSNKMIANATQYIGRDGLHVPVAQVETATVAGNITTSGNASVVVTAAGMTGTPKTISVAVVAGTAQVETATAAGTVTTAGNASVVVTAAGMTGSPKTISVPVELDDGANDIATAIRTALAADTAVDAMFDVSGTGAEIILTRNAPAANDTTLNIAIADGTSAGITTAASSANTTAGVAQDNAASVATKAAAALNADGDVDAIFTAASDGAEVTLTRDAVAANDATLNIAIANGTCAGLTAAATSESTTAGVAADAVKPIGVRGYDKITVCVKNSYNQTVKVSLGLYDGIGTGFDTDRIATTAVKSFATTVQDVYTAKDDTLLLYTIFKGIALKVIQDSTPPASGTMDVTVYGVRA